MLRKRPSILLVLLIACMAGPFNTARGETGPVEKLLQRFAGKRGPAAGHPRLSHRLLHVIDSLETPSAAVAVDSSVPDTGLFIRAALPRGMPVEWVIWRLSLEADKSGYRVADCVVNEQDQTFIIRFESAAVRPHRTVLETKPSTRYFSETARMAVLVESFRFESNRTTLDFLAFPEPLTFSLAPNDSNSPWVAQAIEGKDKEVVIALALESQITGRTVPGTIMVHYSDEAIRKIVDDAAKRIPNYSGFVSREGSRALEDTRVMKILLEAVRRRNGYFVDGGGARNSAVPALAHTLKVPFQSVHGHISPQSRTEEVERRIEEFAAIAQKRGSFLLSAEASPALITGLNNRLGFLKQNGVKLVYISKIVQHQ